MSAGNKITKAFGKKDIDFRNTLLPSIEGLADGTYVLSVVVASGVASLASAYYNLSQLGEDYGY